jgi:mannose-6-phosphate isomerase-like protein (cupin superfamily)
MTEITDHRPWGHYTVLADEANHKVKRIVVLPGKRLSLQRHQHRAEHWFVVKGEAKVTLDEQQVPCGAGRAIDIPLGTKHRIENVGAEELVFIEVQTGTYFGEDDIERFEDDFGRVA